MTFFVPIKTVSEANTREHWRVKAKRVKAQRLSVQAVFPMFAKHLWPSPSKDRLVVTLTRFGRRLLDSDNLQSSFKAVRDQVAACLGRDDGPKSGIRWDYEQFIGPVPMVQIEINVDE